MATENLLSEYLSEQATANELGVCIRTLKRWRTLRTGPLATRIGRRIVYRRSTVATWLENQQAA